MATLSKQQRTKANIFDQLNEVKMMSVKMTGGKTLKIIFSDTSITRCSALVFGSTGANKQVINQVVSGTFTTGEEPVINLNFDTQCYDYLSILSAYDFKAEEVKS